MEPIAVTVRGKGRWVLIHRCTHCGRLRLNKIAGDDNLLLLMQIAALPLTMPPFPFGGSGFGGNGSAGNGASSNGSGSAGGLPGQILDRPARKDRLGSRPDKVGTRPRGFVPDLDE